MGSALTEEQHQRLALLMRMERDRLVAQSVALGHTFDELVAAADLEPPDDEHDPDGTTAYERAQVSSMRATFELGASALDAALSGLDAGTYGWCARCGHPIPYERLEAVLGTDRCVACAAGQR